MESKIWNSIVSNLPNPHFLQTHEWGQVKAKYGWQPMYVVWSDKSYQFYRSDQLDLLDRSDQPDTKAACMILKKTIPMGGMSARLSVLYAPKGPLLDWTNATLRNRVLNDLQTFARKEGGIFLKMDPDVILGTGVPASNEAASDPHGQEVLSELKRRGWRYSSDQIQFKNTVLVDLSPLEEELLARMKQKTRYNIRLAEKKGVTLRVGIKEDLGMLYKMYAETSVRDGFVIRNEEYYKTVWALFMAGAESSIANRQSSIVNRQSSIANRQSPIVNRQSPIANRQSPIVNRQSPIANRQSPIANHQSPIVNHQSSIPLAEPLIAEVDGQPVAAIFVFYFAGRAYYVYGMSRQAHREKMPTYLLQWEAMKRAQAKGCTIYDLWGAPDVFDESDPLWGVYRFKEGLGGKVVRTLGAWDFAPNPFWYKLYSEVIPRVLDVMRSRGKTKTKQSLGGA